MRRIPLSLTVVLAITATAAAGCAGSRPTLAGPAAASCSEQSVAVTLSATDPTTYRIVGWLCPGQGDPRRSRTVHLLVSGLTYDHIHATGQPQ